MVPAGRGWRRARGRAGPRPGTGAMGLDGSDIVLALTLGWTRFAGANDLMVGRHQVEGI